MHFELDDDFSSKRIMSQKGHHTGFSHPLKHVRMTSFIFTIENVGMRISLVDFHYTARIYI